MPKSRTPFPKEGEFIVAKVTDIENQYVYVELLDYKGLPSEHSARGMVHISEISSRWIKNIRTHLREGQRIVLRVIRVDPEKGHVDLSYRRTNDAQRKNKMKEWKYAVKFENLLQFFVNEYENLSLDDAYEKIGFPILKLFDDNYQDVVEELKENGEDLLNNIEGITEEQKASFLKIVDENVEISTINILGKITLKFNQNNGIDLLKETLLKAQSSIKNPRRTRNLELTYIAAPKYRLEIIAKDYLDAENILSDALEVFEENAKKYNALYSFERD
ncbi:MAG: S1 RNA-binding domain-containing protein [Candidatus Lokiarchaeota archaeon]|nr:S1 RNA-binding domain-containing protein [Candidatus Lokiarchaeota archaeon]